MSHYFRRLDIIWHVHYVIMYSNAMRKDGWMKANHHKWLQNGCGYLTLSDLDGRNQEGRHCGIDTLVSLWSTRTWYGHNNIIICNCPIHQSTRHHYFIHFVFCPKPLMRSTVCLCSSYFHQTGHCNFPTKPREKENTGAVPLFIWFFV